MKRCRRCGLLVCCCRPPPGYVRIDLSHDTFSDRPPDDWRNEPSGLAVPAWTQSLGGVFVPSASVEPEPVPEYVTYESTACFRTLVPHERQTESPSSPSSSSEPGSSDGAMDVSTPRKILT